MSLPANVALSLPLHVFPPLKPSPTLGTRLSPDVTLPKRRCSSKRQPSFPTATSLLPTRTLFTLKTYSPDLECLDPGSLLQNGGSPIRSSRVPASPSYRAFPVIFPPPESKMTSPIWVFLIAKCSLLSLVFSLSSPDFFS